MTRQESTPFGTDVLRGQPKVDSLRGMAVCQTQVLRRTKYSGFNWINLKKRGMPCMLACLFKTPARSRTFNSILGCLSNLNKLVLGLPKPFQQIFLLAFFQLIDWT